MFFFHSNALDILIQLVLMFLSVYVLYWSSFFLLFSVFIILFGLLLVLPWKRTLFICNFLQTLKICSSKLKKLQELVKVGHKLQEQHHIGNSLLLHSFYYFNGIYPSIEYRIVSANYSLSIWRLVPFPQNFLLSLAIVQISSLNPALHFDVKSLFRFQTKTIK